MIKTNHLEQLKPIVQQTNHDPQVHTKMRHWAQRVKRLMYSKSQVSAGLSRFVIDAEIEPYRVYYRQHGAQLGATDEQMITWFYEQTE